MVANRAVEDGLNTISLAERNGPTGGVVCLRPWGMGRRPPSAFRPTA